MGIFIHGEKEKIDDDKLLELIDSFKGRLYKIAYVYTKNQEDAKDILQDTVYKAFLNISQLKDINSFQGWVTRILINSALDFIKKNKKYIHDNKNIIENIAVNDTDYIDLYEAIDKLSSNLKSVIILKYFEDYKISDIAMILHISESQVKNYLHKGLVQLRKDFSEEAVEALNVFF